jgi:hypothetical protein
MNTTELETLLTNFVYPPIPNINVSELCDKTPRTLLFGYNACLEANGHANTVHVYLSKDGELVSMLYNPQEHIKARYGQWLPLNEIIPTKRIYPEYSDFEFCNLLLAKHAVLSFCSYSAPSKSGPFFGKLLGE